MVRAARVLARILGISAAVAGSALVVWLGAAVLSSPTASAQTLPSPPGYSTPAHHGTPPTQHPASVSTPTSVRSAQARQAMDDEMDHAAKATAKKTHAHGRPARPLAPTSTPASVRSAQARQAMDDEMDQAAKAAAVQKAAAAKRQELIEQANLRVAVHDPQARAEMTASARATRAAAAQVKKIDDWMSHHPYAAAVLAAADTHYANPNLNPGDGLNGSDASKYQETWKWVSQENEVVNPGGLQGGSPMYEDYVDRLYARHNRVFYVGDPIINEKDNIERSNAPAEVKKLFQEARDGRGDAQGKFDWYRDAVDGLLTLDH